MNNPLRNQIQQFYDASTPLWLRTWGEHMHHGYYGADGSEKKDHLQAQVDLIEELLAWGDVGNPNSIVDIGCGVGGSSIHLAQKYGATADGMTLSPVQAERGNARAEELGLQKRVKIHVADAMQPPFENSSFNLAWSCESGEHMPDKRLFLRSAFNILKPGGHFLMATWCHRPEPPVLAPKEQAFLKDMCNAYHLPYIISNPNYAELAKEEGFTNIHIEDWTNAVAPFWPAVVRSALSVKSFVGLMQAGWPTIRGALAMRYMMRGYKTGLIRFGVLKAVKP